MRGGNCEIRDAMYEMRGTRCEATRCEVRDARYNEVRVTRCDVQDVRYEVGGYEVGKIHDTVV